ncbi:MAG: acylphosphatase [Desulfuromonadales bacterium C00003107]|nr:MAG: acylphosphatase [Desulfuromonadales bacterium C00003107]
MNRIRVKLAVRGQVQGVGFRYFTLRTAQELQLTGWVRNCEDGSVEAVLEGPEEFVSDALVDLRQGPESGHVEALHSENQPYRGEFNGFEVRF